MIEGGKNGNPCYPLCDLFVHNLNKQLERKMSMKTFLNNKTLRGILLKPSSPSCLVWHPIFAAIGASETDGYVLLRHRFYTTLSPWRLLISHLCGFHSPS